MAPGRLLRSAALAAVAAGAFLLLAAGDLALRSRSALLEAEKQEQWAGTPALKTAALEAEFGAKLAALERGAGGISAEELERSKDLLAAQKHFNLAESPQKLAYLWYKTAAEDFNFPANPWAAAARRKLPGALAAWRAELAARGVKAEPWMTE